MLDLVSKSGVIVDGSGAPAFSWAGAIQQGKIVAVAPYISEQAHRTIDAAGQVVAPGFIDMHTHYDAQVLWDPLCTSAYPASRRYPHGHR